MNLRTAIYALAVEHHEGVIDSEQLTEEILALVSLTPYEKRVLATWIDAADFEGDVAPSQIQLAERFGAKVPWARLEQNQQAGA